MTEQGRAVFASTRREIRRLMDRSAPTGDPWAQADGVDEILASIERSVDELRHCAHLVGGEPADAYATPDSGIEQQLRDKLKRLAKLGGPAIVVAESPALGGYGCSVGGRLYNRDTLKHHEIMVALRRAGVLDDLRRAKERRVVCQIGSGWGGLAYQLKRLCPRLRLVLVAPLEHLAVAAVYLRSLFPEAESRFVDPNVTIDASLDLAFVPLQRGGRLPIDHLDLLVRADQPPVGSAADIDGWARRASELNCPFWYSLERREGDSPRPVERWSRWYWPHEIPVLPVSHDQTLDGVARGKSLRARLQREEQAPPPWVHYVGWKRWAA